jgi:ketosteroid isomerase-like protein
LALLAITLAVIGPGWTHVSAGQRNSNPQDALRQMADTERAFAARAAVVNWKQAFLEYFADSAVGFDATGPGLAKDQIRALPEPPKDAQLLWEPRFGDIAASGDLGWLTGPSTSINPARDKGQPRHGNYASVWKRQADGTFKVVMDVGVNLPGPASFAPGFTRAPQAKRYSGAAADAQTTLADADRALLSRAAASSQADAYRGRLAPGARLHRHDMMPRVGEREILAWLATQPASPAAEHRYAEAAKSGDLGYTWGRYGMGYYVRVWSRAADGSWRVALDVLQ